MGSAVETTSGSLECWEIIHIPEKPPICPDRQPTGIILFIVFSLEYLQR